MEREAKLAAQAALAQLQEQQQGLSIEKSPSKIKLLAAVEGSDAPAVKSPFLVAREEALAEAIAAGDAVLSKHRKAAALAQARKDAAIAIEDYEAAERFDSVIA